MLFAPPPQRPASEPSLFPAKSDRRPAERSRRRKQSCRRSRRVDKSHLPRIYAPTNNPLRQVSDRVKSWKVLLTGLLRQRRAEKPQPISVKDQVYVRFLVPARC